MTNTRARQKLVESYLAGLHPVYEDVLSRHCVFAELSRLSGGRHGPRVSRANLRSVCRTSVGKWRM